MSNLPTCSSLPGFLEIAGAFALAGFTCVCLALLVRLMPSEKSFHPAPRKR